MSKPHYAGVAFTWRPSGGITPEETAAIIAWCGHAKNLEKWSFITEYPPGKEDQPDTIHGHGHLCFSSPQDYGNVKLRLCSIPAIAKHRTALELRLFQQGGFSPLFNTDWVTGYMAKAPVSHAGNLPTEHDALVAALQPYLAAPNDKQLVGIAKKAKKRTFYEIMQTEYEALVLEHCPDGHFIPYVKVSDLRSLYKHLAFKTHDLPIIEDTKRLDTKLANCKEYILGSRTQTRHLRDISFTPFRSVRHQSTQTE